jgi:hypothetical protein
MSESGVKLAPCTCRHEYQDKAYGKGLRVHNVVLIGKNKGKYICTVCGTRKG